jgi:hypothetical protein
MNRRLAEWAARIDRHDLVRLAADHDLIVLFRREAQVRRGDPHFPVALLDQAGDLPGPVLPRSRLNRIALHPNHVKVSFPLVGSELDLVWQTPAP